MGAGDLLKFFAEKAPAAADNVSRAGLASLDLLAQNPEIIPNIEKLREQEEPELFTHIFGIPTPFMQLGTYLGMEGWKGLAVDIIADPLNYIGGLGSLTGKAARGGRLARAFEGADRVAAASGKAGDLVREIGFKSGNAASKARMLDRIGMRMAQLDITGHKKVQDLLSLAETERDAVEIIDNLRKLKPVEEIVETGSKEQGFSRFRGYRPAKQTEFEILNEAQRAERQAFEIGESKIRPTGSFGKRIGGSERDALIRHMPGNLELDGIRNAYLKGGMEGGKAHVQGLIDKREELKGMLAAFADAGSTKEALSIAKQIEKLEPNRSYQVLFGKEGRKRWKSYFGQLEKTGKVEALGRTAEEQIALGQRNLVTVAIPFIPGSERVIATGAPLLQEALRGVRAVQGSKLGKALTGTKAGAFAGAAAASGMKAGAFDRRAAYDSVQEISDQFFRSMGGGGLGVPEGVDDIFKQYQAMREHSTGLAAMWGDEIRGAARGQDDLIRLAMDRPVDYFDMRTDVGKKGVGIGFDDNITRFPKDRLRPEHQGKFDDLTLGLMQTLESHHIRANKVLVANGMLGEAIQNYLPRLVTKVNKPEEWERFLRQIPARASEQKSHFRARSIEALREAFELEKKGVIEIEHDLGKIEAHWMNEVLKSAQQKRLYERLQKAQIPLADKEGSIPLLTLEGSKSFKAHPNEYVRTKNPHITRIFANRSQKAPAELLIHKRFAKDMEVAFGGQPLTAGAGLPAEQKLADWLLKANVFTKRAVMGSDAVTYGWFTERAAGTLGRQWLASPVAQTRMGAYHRARATDLWDTAFKAGLKGQPIEADVDTYLDVLDTVAKWADNAKVPLVGRAMRAWRGFSATIEQPAWQYFHPSLKMTAFSTLYEKALMDPRFAKIPMNEIAQGVAAHVNNAFSGLNWERMWVGAPGQKWLRLLMVAPDWTLSTIKLGADLFANQVARVPFLGRDMVAPAVRAAYARDYAVRAGIFTFGLLELANLATSSDPMTFLKTGQLDGHYMSDNEEGKRAQLALPLTEDGKRLYWLPMKQWQDFASLANVFGGGDPFKFFKNRMGLVPNAFNTVVGGRDSFGYPIVATEDGFVTGLGKRLGWLASSSILPSYAQTMLGVGTANARPLRGALEFGLSVRTGREQARPENVEEPQELIDLQQEPAPPPDPVPPEFEAALAQELQENPTYLSALNLHLQKMQQENVSGLMNRVLAGRR